MKEIVFIYTECGISESVFYFFYKVKLRLYSLLFFKLRRTRRKERIGHIYNALSILKNGTTSIAGNRYLNKESAFFPGVCFRLRPSSSDEKVFHQIMEKEEYKCVVEIYLQLFKNQPSQIIDCGANIGLASVYFHHHFPGANFLAIEPFKANNEVAKLNFEAAKLNNILLLEGGIWNKDTTLGISREFRDKKEWSVSLVEKNGATDVVPAYSLSRIVQEYTGLIDILKIDIEGAEKELFENGDYAALFLNKVKCIALEIHNELGIRPSICKVLENNNFFYYNTNELTIGINRSYL